MNERRLQEAVNAYTCISFWKKKIVKSSWEYATEKRITYGRKSMREAEAAGRYLAKWECLLASWMVDMSQEETAEYYRRVEAVRNGTNTGETEPEENPRTTIEE